MSNFEYYSPDDDLVKGEEASYVKGEIAHDNKVGSKNIPDENGDNKNTDTKNNNSYSYSYEPKIGEINQSRGDHEYASSLVNPSNDTWPPILDTSSSTAKANIGGTEGGSASESLFV